MEELFGLSMTTLMYVLLGVVLISMAVLGVLAARNRIMLKMGLRPIPRRPGQTALIIMGVMLSTVIMAAAFGTGDTLSHTIRNGAVEWLQEIDELIVPTRAGEDARFGAAYITEERFEELLVDLSANDKIDGIMPQVAESVSVRNVRTGLSEGRMRLVGIDSAMLAGFQGPRLEDGGEARLEDLAPDGVYVSEPSVEELEVQVGDEIEVFLEGGSERLRVEGIVSRGGFAGIEPTVLVPLERAQEMLGRPAQINTIVISNRGDSERGVDLSEDVTRDLRVLFTDREIAGRLKALFGREDVLGALDAKVAALELEVGDSGSNDELDDLRDLTAELRKPDLTDELSSLLSDPEVTRAVVEQMEEADLDAAAVEAYTLLAELAEFQVMEIKRDIIDSSEEAGTGVTSIFILFSSFSIMVGILLIFLIFVMLASARKSEMGMARAVGAKRRHLVMMFAFEGTAYAIVSAAVGVVLGLGVSALMVTVMNQIFSGLDESFTLTIHFEPRSVVVAYCLGMAITFATVVVSAYRVSRLNIVVAIRGLPESIIPKGEPSFRERLLGLLRSVVLPAYHLVAAFRALFRRRVREFGKGLGLFVVTALPPVWAVAIVMGVLRFIQPYLLRGWLVLVAGVVLTYFGAVVWERWSWFGAGVSLTVVGLGLMLRWGLGRTEMRDETVDRIAYTAAGLVMLVYWALPESAVRPLVGELEGDFDIMFVSGVAMVGAAVWAVMYNSDLLVRGLSALTSRFGRVRPALVTAVAYPMSSKFRTGLTLAMFALVIFTLVIMSVLTEAFTTQFDEPRKVYMGFDAGGSINFTTPVDDIHAAIDAADGVSASDFEAVGGVTNVPVEMRQSGGESGRWRSRTAMLVDEGFLSAADVELKVIADGYGPTAEDVLAQMRDDPSLALVGGWLLPNNAADIARDPDAQRLLGDLHYDSSGMEAVSLDVRESFTDVEVSIEVIGVVDRVHSDAFLVIGSKSLIDGVAPFPIPVAQYRFRLSEGVDAKGAANALEAALLENGMQAEVFEETIDEQNAAGQAFFRLFTGFMALGLLVGVAALGVVSTRAVVERRQHIGMLRAIGYKRGMVALSFLLESSFVSVLGAIIGLALGLLLSYNAVNSIRAEAGIEGITFSVPWMQLGVILALTYGFSLLTTFIPARQASRIYPAEALRYE